MIKVVACDLDGTLLNEEQKISNRTWTMIKKICDFGIRFVIVTGRDFFNTVKVLDNQEVVCDFILNSGGEIRDQDKNILKVSYMNLQDCINLYHKAVHHPVIMLFNAVDCDYYIGTDDQRKQILDKMQQMFDYNETKIGIEESRWFYDSLKKAELLENIGVLIHKKLKITKIMMRANDPAILQKVKLLLQVEPTLAVASSFDDNLEITDVSAQKGPVLKSYIEDLGYEMDEVMVFGDSFNDYSMLSMDFGATVAMKNAPAEIKAAAKYITKSNEEDGVAYALEELLKNQIDLEAQVRYAFLFLGDVQQSGFRYKMKELATEYELEGYCRNLYSGEVYVELQGRKRNIKQLLKRINDEKRFSITQKTISQIRIKKPSGFRIVY